MIYLKTIFSAPWEVNFIKLNMLESYYYVDSMIVCEFNRTHTGQPRKFIFHEYLSLFSSAERKKIIYLPIDLSDDAIEASNSSQTHYNERLMRGAFVKYYKINPEDIIFSVDADEVIDARFYSPLLRTLGSAKHAIVRLPMYQFYYKINFLWENLIFKSAIACRAAYFLNTYPAQWRDAGPLYYEYVGCHFSWCMSVDAMLEKMGMYSHSYDYAHARERAILEQAIANKTYPFNPDVRMQIKTLDIQQERILYPQSLYGMLEQFTELIAVPDVLRSQTHGKRFSL